MAYTRQYTDRVNWQNSPSLATPLNATNLNKMDAGLADIDSAVASEFESVEQDISDLQSAVGGAVTDVTVGGASVVSQGVAAIPAIPSVPVQDVQVDDVSIVDGNGVAKLDSSDFGTTVVANPSGTPSANLQKLQVGNGIYGIEQVSANVAVSTLAAPLTTLKIGDDEYTVPSGGGGTTVVANPSGSATDDLEKIQIGSTIYDIPGSGSGGQQYTCDLLFENDPLPSPTSGTNNVTRTYTLAHSIDDYDAVYVIGYSAYSSSAKNISHSNLVLKPDYYLPFTSTVDNPFELNGGNKDANRRLWFSFPTSTSIQTIADRSESNVEPILYKVYGLKFAATTINNPVYLSDYYSTEERVVGRWTDGRPLYQKSVVQDLTLSASWQNYASVAGMNVVDVEINKLLRDNEPIPAPFTTDGICSWIIRDGYLKMAVQGSFASEGWVLKSATIKYTKTADAAGTGPTAGNIIYLPALYSEEEREVGVWIDGKPLYQKTVHYTGTLSYNVDDNAIPHGISNIGESMVLSGYGYTTGGNRFLISKTTTQKANDIGVSSVDSTNIYLMVGSNYAGTWQPNEVYITIQYTKTTDTPGSGTWTPEGQLAHHYMTSEHIVGTWIDGSTLYERTWDFSSNPIALVYNNWVDLVDVTALNISGQLVASVARVGGMIYGAVEARVYNNTLSVQRLDNTGNTRQLTTITIQYTKSSS